MVFNKNVSSPNSDNSELMETMNTFKYQKLWEGLEASRDMLNGIQLELVSSH